MATDIPATSTLPSPAPSASNPQPVSAGATSPVVGALRDDDHTTLADVASPTDLPTPQESDARSEPLPPKTNGVPHTNGVVPHKLMSPPDGDGVQEDTAPPARDQEMSSPQPEESHAEQVPRAGDSMELDAPLAETEVNTPTTAAMNGLALSHPSTSTPPDSSPAPVTPSATAGQARPAAPDAEQPRPAKRARNAYGHASTSRTPSTPSTLSVAQHRFALAAVRALKTTKDSAPFLRPVDHVALQIPHYPAIVKNPMDLSTVERKLKASGPARPVSDPPYTSADMFIADVRLIFQNSYTFNGMDHIISHMAKRLEEIFEKQITKMPPPEEPKPAPVPKAAAPKPKPPPVIAAPPPPPPPAPKPKAARRSSTSVPTIRRSEPTNAEGSRPKREIHPPPPKDLPYDVPAPKPRVKGAKGKPGRKKIRDDGTLEQLRFCAKLLTDLHKKQYSEFAYFFYEPVDATQVPNYYKIIKSPMDFYTMKGKLDRKEYADASKFHADFRLLLRNCFKFNPAGTIVHDAGMRLQKVFDEKWVNLPPLRAPSPEEEDEEDTDDEHAMTIAMMENQIETMRDNLLALKSRKEKKEKKPKVSGSKAPSGPPAAAAASTKANGAASSGKAPAKPRTTKKSAGKSKKAKEAADPNEGHRELTFDEKKLLSDSIQALEGDKLERVIQIIHEGVPEIKDNTEEIEVEIDMLAPSVLMKLWNFVIKPRHSPPKPKGVRGRNAAGTGGVKRKSMDEAAESEKIRQLEARMRMFEQAGTGGAGAPAAVATAAQPVGMGAGADVDESASSDSGSSGSESGSESD